MYDYYKNKGESDEEAKNHDSVDIGWLLLEVILEMPQKFRAKRIFRKTYTYIPEQSFIYLQKIPFDFFKLKIKNKRRNQKNLHDEKEY